MPKATAAPPPSWASKPAWASSIESTSITPWKSAAATISIDMFTSPAMPMASPTSRRSKRSSSRRSPSFQGRIRFWVSAEWR